MSHHVLSAGTLKGDEVHNKKGETLGRIEEFMIDLKSGRIAYAVLDSEGKLFAVPWSALKVRTDERKIQLDISKDRFLKSSGFDRDNWPDTANHKWHEEVHAHYDLVPFWKPGAP